MQYNNQLVSCFDVWHNKWQCGSSIPTQFKGRHIRACTVRRRKPADGDDGEEFDGGDDVEEEKSDLDNNETAISEKSYATQVHSDTQSELVFSASGALLI